MRRGGGKLWWQFFPLSSNEMNYECDAGLGSPSEVDCTQIEWQQVSPASDTLTVSPGRVIFLHSS